MKTTETITFLGTGLMGLPMARNLLRAGYPLTAWNRTPEKALPLQAHGAVLASSIAAAVADADVIISMLSDGKVLGSLLADPAICSALPAGAVWIDMSSTRPAEARASATTLAGLGLHFVDAPVSGGTKGAEAASLAIMAGADGADFGRVTAVLSRLGRPVHVGPVGSGQLAKLANQLIVASTIGAVAEAMLLLEKGGADPAAVRHALQGGFADSTILQQHGTRMSERNFEPGGPSRLQLKDLDNILLEAAAHELTLPMTMQVRERFNRYVTQLGGADRDHSGLFEELLDLNR